MRKKAQAAVNSQSGKVLACVVSLILSYVLGSRAIDTGSWWEYSGSATFFIIGVKYLIRSFKK